MYKVIIETETEIHYYKTRFLSKSGATKYANDTRIYLESRGHNVDNVSIIEEKMEK